MDYNQDKLHILGRASSVVVKKLQKHHSAVKENTIWLFAGYNFSDYKVGSSFDIFIKESDQTWNHDYKIRLQKIFDEYGRNYAQIPEGYKTLCLFECIPTVPANIKQLPVLKTWEVTDKSIYLCNHSNIDLLHDRSYDSALFSVLSEMVVSGLRKKNKKVFSMQDIVGLLPQHTSQLIIDNLFISGALKKNNNELILVE